MINKMLEILSEFDLTSQWSDPSIPFGCKCDEPTPTVLRQTYRNIGFRTGGRPKTLMLPDKVVVDMPSIYDSSSGVYFSKSSHGSKSVFESTMNPLDKIISSDTTDAYSTYEFGVNSSKSPIKSVWVGSKAVCIDSLGFDTDPSFGFSKSVYTAFQTPILLEYRADKEPSFRIDYLPEPLINTITRNACLVYMPGFSCFNFKRIDIGFSEYRVFSYPVPDSSVINIIAINQSDLSLNLSKAQSFKVHVQGHVDNVSLGSHSSVRSVINKRMSTVFALVVLKSSFLAVFNSVIRLAKLAFHNILYGPETYMLVCREQHKSIYPNFTINYLKSKVSFLSGECIGCS